MSLAEALLVALYVQIPIVVGGVLHMVVVSRRMFPRLATPVHAGLFGANKTWRGFVVVPLATVIGMLCIAPFEWLLGDAAVFGLAALVPAGLVGGAGYVLAELPNSWIKRRLGIAPGATPDRHRRLFIAIDQVDSGLGVAIAWAIWPQLPLPVCLLYALTFPLTALGVKRLLHRARLKSSAY